ncbi:MAG TPA: ATP-binding protein [Alphaproteobacteria bacterium]|nr:ATP-binding protein [Alphaproteobacteria bacterium]
MSAREPAWGRPTIVADRNLVAAPVARALLRPLTGLVAPALGGLGGALAGASASLLDKATQAGVVAGAVLGGLCGASIAALAYWAIRRAEDRYFLATLDINHVPHVVTRGENILYLSPAARAVLPESGGPRLGELVGKQSADGQRQIAYLTSIAAQGGRAGVELAMRGQDDTTQWYAVTARPLARRPGRILWRIEDVTARREMEEVIREEQGKLVDFLDNAAAGFYSVDETGRFHYVNHTFASWLGLRPDDMLKGEVRLHDFLATPPVAGTPPHEVVHDAADPKRSEVVLKARDGREVPVSVAQTVKVEPSGALRTRSIVRDLSAERRLIEVARRSEGLFNKLFEESPIGVAVLDASGRVRECNPAFKGFTGGDGAGPIGRNLQDLVAQQFADPLMTRLRETVGGTRVTTPVEVELAGSRPRAGAIYFLPMDADGGEPRAMAHLIDLTQQKYFEAQAAQSQKMQAVGQLAGGIAHDFNNLLTVMIGFCDLLLLRHRPGEQTFADIMQIKQNANRAANLVRQLLAFSRQQTLQPKVLDITDVLADLSNLLRRLIGVNIALKVVHGRDLGLIRVDQVQLEQVLINLVVNARDAMPNGGTLTVRTSNLASRESTRRGNELIPPGNYVLVEVTDTGIGIPPENLERIFEPFFSTKEVGAGTGLGLATVYGIVKQTGGFIAVDSRVGEGSTFAIYLPRHGQEPEGVARAKEPGTGAAEEQPEVRDLTGAGTILLVEDEDAVRLFASRALKNKGYAVIEAKNGEKAMEALEKAGRRLDLLITDVMMPGMDGPTLVKAARAKFADLKVIFISGYAEDSFREKVESEADIHFLPKPFSLLQLAGKVKQVLG